jgi:hypothetical protein
MRGNWRKPVVWLAVALVIVLAGSYVAQMFHTSNGQVDVQRISFDTEKGTLSGLLYLPDGAGKDSPRPAVVVTHGYLNSAEMQDANAIELSRRGYVVLALDMYDHGHSASSKDNTGGFFGFWTTAMYDAASYMYDQPYVLKDAAGNGIIGVTGHSMGGFSSSMAVFTDEQTFAQTGIRKIYAELSEGSDYQFSAYVGLTPEVAAANGGGRTLGKVAAQFDEFFFLPDGYTGGSVIKKDYVTTASGKIFLGQEAGKPDTWYDAADGGKRIVYEPYQTHPWNHFSAVTTAHAIDFYTAAFADYNSALPKIDSANQTWFWKEFFELVALVGFVMMFVPLIMLLEMLPFFRLSKTELLAPHASASTAQQKTRSFLILLLAILIPALIFPAVMDKKLDGAFMSVLKWASLAGIAGGLVVLVLGLIKKSAKSISAWTGVWIAAASAGLWYLASYTTFETAANFPAPTVNQIVYWALVSGLLGLLLMSLYHLFYKKREGLTALDYGVKASPVTVLSSFVTALAAVVIGYLVVFIVDKLFLTDFRFWVFAFKTFEISIPPIALHYLPFFFVFYFINTVAVCVNTNTARLQGFRGYLVAIALNAGGIMLYLIAQYGLLFATGTAMFTTQSLSSILLFGFIPTLIIAAIFARALYKRNGNIWVPAFLSSLLLTLMTVANTCVYFQR